MKKIVLVLLFVTSFMTAHAFAQFVPMPDLGLGDKKTVSPTTKTPEELAYILSIKKKCPEGSKMIAEVGGVRYAVPRNGTGFRMENGETLYDFWVAKPNFSCEKNILKDVRAVLMPRLKFGTTKTPDKAGTYVLYKKYIDDAFNKKQITALPSGIQKFLHPNKQWEIYILPPDISPAKDTQPVAMECDVKADMKLPRFDHCDVSYVQPNGIFIDYAFLRQDYEQDNFLDADKDARAKLQQMIEDAKTIPVHE